MEELLLRADLGLEELHVVDEQDVDAAVGGLEGVRVAAVDGADEVIGERLRGGVADGRAGAVGRDVVRDRVQEVGLAQAGRAADEERVVGEPGHLGDGERGGVGEPVGVADDELLEGLAGVEGRLGTVAPVVRGRAGAGMGACAPGGRRLLGRGLPPAGRPRRVAVASRPARCGAWERSDQIDLDVSAQDRRAARLQQPPVAVRDPAPGLVRRLDQQRAVLLPGRSAARAIGARSSRERPVAARRGSVARTMRARDRTRTRGRASSTWEEGAADGDGGPDRARSGEHSTASWRQKMGLRKTRGNRLGGSRGVGSHHRRWCRMEGRTGARPAPPDDGGRWVLGALCTGVDRCARRLSTTVVPCVEGVLGVVHRERAAGAPVRPLGVIGPSRCGPVVALPLSPPLAATVAPRPVAPARPVTAVAPCAGPRVSATAASRPRGPASS